MNANLQIPIWWLQVIIGCREFNDDDGNDDNEIKSPDANMVAASKNWMWRDE